MILYPAKIFFTFGVSEKFKINIGIFLWDSHLERTYKTKILYIQSFLQLYYLYKEGYLYMASWWYYFKLKILEQSSLLSHLSSLF